MSINFYFLLKVFPPLLRFGCEAGQGHTKRCALSEEGVVVEIQELGGGGGLKFSFARAKFLFISSDKPKFKDSLIARIFCNPSNVKCSLLFIRLIVFLNKIKSAFFFE